MTCSHTQLSMITRIAKQNMEFKIDEQNMSLGLVTYFWNHMTPEEAFFEFLLRVVSEYGLPKDE